MYTLTERTYVNADSTKVVAEGSAEAAYLLGTEGDEISDETAARLGLLSSGTSYSKMKVDELRELATSRSIEGAADLKKAELVEALEQADAGESATAETGGTADVGNPAEA